jgi:two-component system, OmpR family, sensor kinase
MPTIPVRRFGFSLRLRIVAWILLLVCVVLALSVLATRAFLVGRLGERIDRELAQEVAQLRVFAETGIDPTTGEPFTDPGALLGLHLQRSIPDRNETMFTIVDGVVVARSGDDPPARLDLDAAFVSEASAAQAERTGRWQTQAGEVRFAVVPVRPEATPGAQGSGAFVVAIFYDAEASQIRETMAVFIAASALALIGVSVLSWWVAGRALAPLQSMRSTARSITESDLTGRIPLRHEPGQPPRDELDDLAETFNDTLDRLEGAMTAQRQFVDDAGHELRTPLTIIRGHLELLDEDPDRRAATLAVVGDELDRMSRLVSDLLTLTKAENPTFLELAPVDVAPLTEELLVKAAAIADRDWVLDGAAEGVVRADRHRLTQAVLQLADNAARHTQPGNQIGVGSRLGPGGLEIWVRDTGPGVPDDLADRAFDRFTHGPQSSGAGLGLAIVGALARAHGGRAILRNTPGGGATFTLLIPAHAPPGVATPQAAASWSTTPAPPASAGPAQGTGSRTEVPR